MLGISLNTSDKTKAPIRRLIEIEAFLIETYTELFTNVGVSFINKKAPHLVRLIY